MREGPPIRVDAGADGSLFYLVDLPPEALPPVRRRDLAAAWDAARGAAAARLWSVARGLRFRRGDGSFTDLALADRDARCWAGAIDSTVGMHTSYGLSLCLRLLALVELLAKARWATELWVMTREGAELDPDLLRIAATTTLTADARFDERGVRAQLSSRHALTGARA